MRVIDEEFDLAPCGSTANRVASSSRIP